MRRRELAAALALPLLASAGSRAETDPDRLPSWFIFLETGRKTPDDAAAVQAMQRGHIDNFKRLFALRRLQAAGPLADPARLKRGIVVVRAGSRDELTGYFQPDDYVREGYMTLNAVPATAELPLQTEGIDASGVVQGRIVLIGRPVAAADAASARDRRALLQTLVDQGLFGGWYTLESGPIAEVLFATGTDSAALQSALAPYPGLGSPGLDLSVWPQWLSKGVVRTSAQAR